MKCLKKCFISDSTNVPMTGQVMLDGTLAGQVAIVLYWSHDDK